MLQNIIDKCLDNPFLVVLVWFMIAIFGLLSLENLPVDAVPDVTNTQVQVLTNSPGMAPEEVERFITFAVESSMNGIPKVEQVRSVSKFGLSVVTVVFKEGTDIYWARQQIGERLIEAQENIPDGYGNPEMGPISSGLGEIFQFEVRGDRYSPMELRSILDWNINFHLRSIPGVVEVNSFGGELKTYQLTVDPNKMASYQIELHEVFEAIQNSNRNAGGGYIEHLGEQYLIRGEALIKSLDDLRFVQIKETSQGPVFLKDLGVIEFAPMIRQGAITRDGKREAVIGIVMTLIGANSRTVVSEVKSKLAKLEKSLPEGVTIDVFYDRTELIQKTISTVSKNLLEGAFFVTLILFLLLGNLRAGLLVAFSIPISFLGAVIGMRFFGLSANLMSLGAVDFGIIVDGSVVMIENIVRVLSDLREDKMLSKIEKVKRAASQVARPTVFGMTIIMIVYLPILSLRGIEGKMFRPMALTVIFALITSLLCAVTLMPVLASFTLKEDEEEKEPFLFTVIQKIYRPLFQFCIQNRLITIFLTLLLFLSSLFIGSKMGAEFIPKLDEGAIAMQIWRLPSVSLEESNRISLEVEKRLLKDFPEIKTVVSRTGRAEIATDPMGVEISDSYIMLHPIESWRFPNKEDLVEAIESKLKETIAGASFSFSQPIELRVSELVSGSRSDIAIKIFGDNPEKRTEVANQIVEIVSKIEGAADAKAEQTQGLPVVRIKLDRIALARYGISAEEVLSVIETLRGKQVGKVLDGQKRFSIQVRYAATLRNDPEKIGRLLIRSSRLNKVVPLQDLAEIRREIGPAQISRENVSRKTTVELNVRGRDLSSFVSEAQRKIDESVKLPEGFILDWGGRFENLEKATKRLLILVPFALVLILALLHLTFGSLKLSSLIYLNLPIAATGGIIALYLRDLPFSISAGVGFISLFGVAVMNGVVLISSAEELRAEGLSSVESISKASKLRLRPVLMSSMTDIIGFLPMAMAVSAGAEVQRPLATVVIGGLCFSVLLTLLVLPTLYPWFSSVSENSG